MSNTLPLYLRLIDCLFIYLFIYLPVLLQNELTVLPVEKNWYVINVTDVTHSDRTT